MSWGASAMSVALAKAVVPKQAQVGATASGSAGASLAGYWEDLQRAEALIGERSLALQGVDNLDFQEWTDFIGELSVFVAIYPSSERVGVWVDALEGAEFYRSWSYNFAQFLEAEAQNARQAYKAAGRDVALLFECRDPMELRMEATRLMGSTSYLENVFETVKGNVTPEAFARRLISFAQGDLL